MRHAIVLLVLFCFATFNGCASHVPLSQRTHPSSPSRTQSVTIQPADQKLKPYTVLGRKYYPLQNADGYDEIGFASWYGEDFHGRKTANGQTYDMYGVSAAHKTLPLGTKVKVTNLENRQSVILTINDRGPFVRGRVLDLSYGAAKKLGTVKQGVAKVRITALGSPSKIITSGEPRSAIKYYHVRVGAFAIRSNAERVYRHLQNMGYSTASISIVDRDGTILHIVQAGSFVSRGKAEKVQFDLKREFPTCYIIS